MTVNQLAIVVGLSCAVFVSYYLSFGEHWGWMLASNAVPVPLFIIGLLLAPESPRWLAQKNRHQEAMEVLTLIDGRQNAEAEMKNILASTHEQGTWRELLRPGVRFALIIACVLAAFQQITGASILTMYMPSVFQDAGFNKPSDAIFQNVIMSIWYIACTVFALLIVDRLGRKPLLLLGTAGMAVGMAILGALFQWQPTTPPELVASTVGLLGSPFGQGPLLAASALFPGRAPTTGGYVLLAMFLVMGAYLVSLAPLAWLIMSEIFPNRLRGKAMAVASVCVWTASFLTAFCYPPLVDFFKETLGTSAMAYWIFGVLSAAACLFSFLVVPETKGRTLEEIGASWTRTEP